MNDNTVRVFTAADLALTPAELGAKYWCVTLPNVMLTFFSVDPHTVFDMHAHCSEQITYVARGTLVFEVNGRRLPVRSGEAIRLPANVPHAARSLEEPVEAFDAWSPPAREPWATSATTRPEPGKVDDVVEGAAGDATATPEETHGLPLGIAPTLGFGVKGLA